MVPVPGQSTHKLNKYAAQSFSQMQADAKKNGVSLVILDSDRSCEAANRGASRVENVFAIATCPNSHTIGLAIDFKMFPGKDPRETNTRPMKNIIDMHQSPVHKWLFLNAQKYGWYPWNYEPWHWEYNPDNFRSKFFSNYNQYISSTP
jgi:LAS superfamily LD-carboxypeptidase LdcB